MVWTDHSIEIYFVFLSRINLPWSRRTFAGVPVFAGEKQGTAPRMNRDIRPGESRSVPGHLSEWFGIGLATSQKMLSYICP